MEPNYDLESLLNHCIKLQITDIHFDLCKDYLVLRRNKMFVKNYPCGEIKVLFNNLKYESHMHIEASLLPQTGAFNYYLEDRVLNLRFACLETFNRKHGVLRILNLIAIDCLDKCGIEIGLIRKIRRLIHLDNGLILFVGKTGVGKSTTLYAALSEINDRQIFMLESPIERQLSNVIQIEYKDTQLRKHITQLLRHDPDVLVIGEIRTSDELACVVRAALSGHLVITTLHAGKIEDVLERLQDLNIGHSDVKQFLKGIVFQNVIQEEGTNKFIFDVLEEGEIDSIV